jgi:hypothetical protein
MRRAAGLFALLGLWVPLSLSASASSKANKKSFTVPEPVRVQNVTLPPGDYQVSWTQEGSNVPVAIRQGKKTIVTVANASVEPQKNPENSYNVGTNGALELTKRPDGTEVLTKIYFSNLAVTLPAADVTR